MEIKSSTKIANSTTVALQSKCKRIGTHNVEKTKTTNIAGVYSAADTFEEINSLHIKYKLCLDLDALKIKDIGLLFENADKNMAETFK